MQNATFAPDMLSVSNCRSMKVRVKMAVPEVMIIMEFLERATSVHNLKLG